MNTPVSYELAKLLKAKGFDEQSLLIYLDGEIEELRSTISNSQCATSRTCSAPIIAEVIMWLYEKYGIWIEVNLTVYEGFKYTIMTHSKLGIIHKMSEPNFKTPTEAYEAALEYVLKEMIKKD